MVIAETGTYVPQPEQLDAILDAYLAQLHSHAISLITQLKMIIPQAEGRRDRSVRSNDEAARGIASDELTRLQALLSALEQFQKPGSDDISEIDGVLDGNTTNAVIQLGLYGDPADLVDVSDHSD